MTSQRVELTQLTKGWVSTLASSSHANGQWSLSQRNQQENQSHLAPPIKQKFSVVFDLMELPNPATAPPNRADIENFLPEIVIKNPYLESDYFAKLTVNTRAQKCKHCA